MNRLHFLKTMLGSGLLVSAPPTELLAPVQTPGPLRSLPLYEAFVAGFAYYAGPALIRRLQPADPLDLVREPHNRHDARAIAVYWHGRKLGFLPMRDNPLLTALIDAGVPLRAAVHRTTPAAPAWEMCALTVSMDYPEPLLRAGAAPQPFITTHGTTNVVKPANVVRPTNVVELRTVRVKALAAARPRPTDPDAVWADWQAQLTTLSDDARASVDVVELVEAIEEELLAGSHELCAFVDALDARANAVASRPLRELADYLRMGL